MANRKAAMEKKLQLREEGLLMQIWFAINPIILDSEDDQNEATAQRLLQRHTTTVKTDIVIDFLSIIYDPYAGLSLTENEE